MSNSFPRGVLDDVVHYCNKSRWAKDAGMGGSLYPWCLLDIHRHDKAKIPFAAPPPRKREPVTCFLCMWIRKHKRG